MSRTIRTFINNFSIFFIIAPQSCLGSNSVSIQFSQDFITSVTQKPWTPPPSLYPKPSEQPTQTPPSNFFDNLATTINRISLGAATYLFIVRSWALHKNILAVDATKSTFLLPNFFKKTQLYGTFIAETAAIWLGVFMVHWCTKNLLRNNQNKITKRTFQSIRSW